MKKIILYGSTGSIGTQALDVIRNNSDFKITALAVKSNIEKLKEQIKEFKPKAVVVYDKDRALQLMKDEEIKGTEVLSGMDGLLSVLKSEKSDIFLNAIVGMIGIRPTVEALNSTKRIAIANKETLVTAGHIIMPAAKEKNVEIVPVDSEHSAIFQCLNGEKRDSVHKILLTASGGPFLNCKKEDLVNVTLEDALKHPNWAMGNKITIDSATMANKALEVMEAESLFNVPVENIQVVIHPQSIIHSMVQYSDKSIIAQLGLPDMRLPIHYSLYYPERVESSCRELEFTEALKLTFKEPDFDLFPCLKLGIEAGKTGGSMRTVFNIANEIAVGRFLAGKIRFVDIAGMIEESMNRHINIANPNLEDIFRTEEEVKNYLLGGE